MAKAVGKLIAEITCPKCRGMVPLHAKELGTVGTCPGCEEPVAFPPSIFDLRKSAQAPTHATVECPACRLENRVPIDSPSGRLQCARCRTSLPAALAPTIDSRVVLHIDPDYPEAEPDRFMRLILVGWLGPFHLWRKMAGAAATAAVCLSAFEAALKFGGAYLYSLDSFRAWAGMAMLVFALVAALIIAHLLEPYVRSVQGLARSTRRPEFHNAVRRRGQTAAMGPLLSLFAWMLLYFCPPLLYWLLAPPVAGASPWDDWLLLGLIGLGAAVATWGMGHAGLMGYEEAVNPVSAVRRALLAPKFSVAAGAAGALGTLILLCVAVAAYSQGAAALAEANWVEGLGYQTLAWAVAVCIPALIAHTGGVWTCLVGRQAALDAEPVMTRDRIKIARALGGLLAAALAGGAAWTINMEASGAYETSAAKTRKNEEESRAKALAEQQARADAAQKSAQEKLDRIKGESEKAGLDPNERLKLQNEYALAEADAAIDGVFDAKVGSSDPRDRARYALRLLESRRRLATEAVDARDSITPASILDKIDADVPLILQNRPAENERYVEALRAEVKEKLERIAHNSRDAVASLREGARKLAEGVADVDPVGEFDRLLKDSDAGAEKIADKDLAEFLAPAEKRLRILIGAGESVGRLPVGAMEALEAAFKDQEGVGPALTIQRTEALWLAAAEGGSRLVRQAYDGSAPKTSQQVVRADPDLARICVMESVGCYIVDPAGVTLLGPGDALRFVWRAPEPIIDCAANDRLLLLASRRAVHLFATQSAEPVWSGTPAPGTSPGLGRDFVYLPVSENRVEWCLADGAVRAAPRRVVWTADGFYGVTRFLPWGVPAEDALETRKLMGAQYQVIGSTPFAAWLTFTSSDRFEPGIPEGFDDKVLACDDRLGRPGSPLTPDGTHLKQYGDWIIGSYFDPDAMSDILKRTREEWDREQRAAMRLITPALGEPKTEGVRENLPPGPERYAPAVIAFGFNLRDKKVWKARWPRSDMEPVYDAAGQRLFLAAAGASGSSRDLMCVNLSDGQTAWTRSAIIGKMELRGGVITTDDLNAFDLATGEPAALPARPASAADGASTPPESADARRRVGYRKDWMLPDYGRPRLAPPPKPPTLTPSAPVDPATIPVLSGRWVAADGKTLIDIAQDVNKLTGVLIRNGEGKLTGYATGTVTAAGVVTLTRQEKPPNVQLQRIGKLSEDHAEIMDADANPANAFYGWFRSASGKVARREPGPATEDKTPPPPSGNRPPRRSSRP